MLITKQRPLVLERKAFRTPTNRVGGSIEGEISEYLQWKASEGKTSAVKAYAPQLLKFNKFCQRNLEDIDITHITSYRSSLLRRFKPSNVAFISIILKDFFSYYVAKKRDCLNPYIIRIPKYKRNPHQSLELEEFIMMDKAIGDGDFFELERKIIHRFLWEMGLRISELCSINIPHLDLDSRSVFIKNRKNDESRWVIWTPETHVLLLKYLGTRISLNQYPALFIASGDFGRRDRITPRTVQRWIKDLCKRVGLKKKISPHGYRHSKALEMLEKENANLKDVQYQLGHQSITSTEWYLHFSKKLSERRSKPYLDRTRMAYKEAYQ